MFGFSQTVPSPGSWPQVRVWSRSREGVERFGRSVSGPVTACVSVEEAVRGADVIVTVTTSTEPVLFGQWVKPGAHVAGEKTSLKRKSVSDLKLQNVLIKILLLKNSCGSVQARLEGAG